MKKILTTFLIILSFSLSAQNEEKEAVMKVINQVFEAMRTNDSTLLKQSFIKSPNMFTVFVNPEGESMLVAGDFKQFINAVGAPKDVILNEPIWNEKVEIDGNLAQVWVDYAFYLTDKFSHCGVDAFHLIKQEGSWKIFHLVDTRRKADCEVPDGIKP